MTKEIPTYSTLPSNPFGNLLWIYVENSDHFSVFDEGMDYRITVRYEFYHKTFYRKGFMDFPMLYVYDPT